MPKIEEWLEIDGTGPYITTINFPKCIAQQELPKIEEWLEIDGTGPYITNIDFS